MDVRPTVRQYIESLLAEHGQTGEVLDSDSLILSGLLDSLSVVHIVVFLESTFGIDFSVIFFDQTEFDSIDSIVNFLSENGVSVS